jgi:hypothetical protein
MVLDQQLCSRRSFALNPSDIPRWKDQLFACCHLGSEEADEEYVRLLGQVAGDEGSVVFSALVASIQAEEDYEVYESTFSTLWKFPGQESGAAVVDAARALRDRPERLGDFLGRFALGGMGEGSIEAFNKAWSKVDEEWKEWLLAFVLSEEEEDGWLTEMDRPGRLRPS